MPVFEAPAYAVSLASAVSIRSMPRMMASMLVAYESRICEALPKGSPGTRATFASWSK